jgi:putative ABC transport system ATP-binding protein
MNERAATERSQAIVSCSDLHRRFGEGQTAVDALKSVSIDFPHGELTGIVGPSGSGKSTLLHILAGLDRPTSGEVIIDGTEITHLDDGDLTRLRRDKLGFIFQFFNLVPVLNAEENVALPVRIAGGDVDREWLDSLLDTVGLADRRTHRPSELSGGQQQRVAIARALMTRPAVVFADEPTGNLDSKSGADVLGLLRKSVDDFGQTVVMVSHDPRVASYADRVVVLADGSVVHDGRIQSADEVLRLMQAV